MPQCAHASSATLTISWFLPLWREAIDLLDNRPRPSRPLLSSHGSPEIWAVSGVRLSGCGLPMESFHSRFGKSYRCLPGS
eukprot:12376342-Alexandrium_andersonii.AAC.1